MTEEYFKAVRAYYGYDIAIRDLQALREVMADNGIEESDAFRSLLGEFYTKRDEYDRKARLLSGRNDIEIR